MQFYIHAMICLCTYVLMYLYIYTSILLYFYTQKLIHRAQAIGHRAQAQGIAMHYYTYMLI